MHERTPRKTAAGGVRRLPPGSRRPRGRRLLPGFSARPVRPRTAEKVRGIWKKDTPTRGAAGSPAGFPGPESGLRRPRASPARPGPHIRVVTLKLQVVGSA